MWLFAAFLWQDPGRTARIKEHVSVDLSSLFLSYWIFSFYFGFDNISFDLQLNQLGLQKFIFALNFDDIISDDTSDFQIKLLLEPLDLNRSPLI